MLTRGKKARLEGKIEVKKAMLEGYVRRFLQKKLAGFYVGVGHEAPGSLQFSVQTNPRNSTLTCLTVPTNADWTAVGIDEEELEMTAQIVRERLLDCN